jgi:putative membrane protein
MLDLSKPQRQSKKSILIYLFKNIKGLLAFSLYAIFGLSSVSNLLIMGGTIIAIAVLALIQPILKYYFFTFYLQDDELIIQQGIIQKERKAIPLERIQSVNIHQNLGQRLLNIVAVEVETAGSKAKELEIPGLEKEDAVAFKDLLKDRTRDNIIEDHSEAVEKSITESEQLQDQPLLKLDIVDLLKVGITQNHLRSGILALGVVFGFWYKIKDIVERYYGDVFENFEWEDIASYASLGLIAACLLVFIVVSLIVSVITVINKYWNFSIFKKGSYLEVEMGLLNRREIKIPINKIQILEFHSNPLRNLLGYKTAKIYQAQSEGNAANNVAIPACREHLKLQLQELVFEHVVEEDAPSLHSNPWSHARLNLYIVSAFTLLPAAVLVYFDQWLLAIVPIAVLVWTTYNAYRSGQWTSISKDKEIITLYSGWLFKKTIITPVFKLQAVEKWRSIFLRRRHELHFKIHTAAGSRGLRYFPEHAVTDLKNQINNQIITTDRYWM